MTKRSLLARVQVSRASGARDLPALETTMQGLALDQRSPVALELAATPRTRRFLLRADRPVALRHLEQQIQARYPQAVILPEDANPLQLLEGEECSVMELRAGASSDLPLRSWKPREWLAEGTDPLLGVLAAFGGLPPGTRAVVQLALLPASPTWSAPLRRRVVEHPLEQERLQHRLSNTQGSTPGMAQVGGMFVLVLALLFAFRFRTQLARMIPPWLMQAGNAILHGKVPQLTGTQTFTAGGVGVLLLMVLLSLMYGAALLTSRVGRTRIYDQRLVGEKTARPAYRVRLRLFVFSRGEQWPRIRKKPARQTQKMGTLFKQRGDRVLLAWAKIQKKTRRFQRLAKRGWKPFWQAAWHRERARLRGWWRRLRATRVRQRVREDLLQMLVASYQQYHLAAGGYFVPRRLSGRRVRRLLAPPAHRWVSKSGWASDLPRSNHYLSVADLAALWHLPQAQDLRDLAYVEHRTMRTLLVPPMLAMSDGYPLGTSTHAGQTLPVFYPYGCLWHNLLVAASTGKGKSTLFAHLLRAYAQARVARRPEGLGGALLIDPHGDLAEQVAGCLPPALVDDIVLIRLADRDYPIGFNPLDLSQGQDRDKTIDNLVTVIEALWPTSYGPRTESFVEYGSKTLADANLTLLARQQSPEEQFTLLDVVALFRHETFRRAVLELVTDQHVLNWWNHYYEQLDGHQQAEFTSSLVTKLSKFASSRISRRILRQPHSSLNFAELIRQNKIVLLSCSAGDVGADLAALFGSLFVGFFQTALREQGHLELEARQRVLVLIDEFQSLVGINYQTMLAELRKYGGSFALATQSLAYLDRFERTLRQTVLANVDHIFAFTMADEDARHLRLPGIEPEDITQLPDYSCYARLSLDGQRLPVFSMHLAPPAQSSAELRREMVSRCSTNYGRPVGKVDEILQSCETRQRTLRPSQKRRGARGYEVIWQGTGEERVEEVLSSLDAHHGGRGKGGRKQDEEPATPAEHTMYASSEEGTGTRKEEGETDDAAE